SPFLSVCVDMEKSAMETVTPTSGVPSGPVTLPDRVRCCTEATIILAFAADKGEVPATVGLRFIADSSNIVHRGVLTCIPRLMLRILVNSFFFIGYSLFVNW